MSTIRPWLWLVILALSVLCASCSTEEISRKHGDVTRVNQGWGMNQVVSTIGKPDYVIDGQGLRTGWEEWVYPTGSVFFYRLAVTNVLKRSPDTPPPPKPKSPWDVPMRD